MFSSERASTVDLEPQFVQCLKLLHSTNKDSADQLRNVVDEVLRQKYGASKMLSNVLHKKYMIEETILSEHSNSSSSKKKSSSSSSSKHANKSSKSNSPVTVQAPEPASDLLQPEDGLALDELSCVMCKEMDFSARNQLVECSDCHSLYHQECHVPHILDSQINVVSGDRSVWYCSKCSKDVPPPKEKEKERSSPKPAASESKSKESKKSNKKQTSKSQKSSSKKSK